MAVEFTCWNIILFSPFEKIIITTIILLIVIVKTQARRVLGGLKFGQSINTRHCDACSPTIGRVLLLFPSTMVSLGSQD